MSSRRNGPRQWALLLATLALAPTMEAQAQFQQIYEVKVRPGGEEAYEALLERLVTAAEQTASPTRWLAFEVVAGKPVPLYRIVLPFEKWADRDAWDGVRGLLRAAYGDAEAKRIWEQSQAAVERVTSHIWQSLPDSDSNPRDTIASFYDVYVREVRAGTEREIRGLHREFKKAYDAAPSKPSVSRSVLVFGTNQGLVFRRSSAFDRWAEMDDAEARQMLGVHFGAERAGAMVDTVRRSAVWTEHFVSAFRPDLSRLEPTNP